MMNNIYDFTELDKIREQQRGLIRQYVIYSICFIALIALLFAVIENNMLLCIAFALLLIAYLLFSLLFWKIKYGILRMYAQFLDNMETGRGEDYIGVFEEKMSCADEDIPFEKYVFIRFGKRSEFLVSKNASITLEIGKEYHIEHIGKYINRWEFIDDEDR